MMSAIGSLLFGNEITMYGAKIFERFNKAVLATVREIKLTLKHQLIFAQWENTLLHNPGEAPALVQAAVYSEIFALLSGVS